MQFFDKINNQINNLDKINNQSIDQRDVSLEYGIFIRYKSMRYFRRLINVSIIMFLLNHERIRWSYLILSCLAGQLLNYATLISRLYESTSKWNSILHKPSQGPEWTSIRVACAQMQQHNYHQITFASCYSQNSLLVVIHIFFSVGKLPRILMYTLKIVFGLGIAND